MSPAPAPPPWSRSLWSPLRWSLSRRSLSPWALSPWARRWSGSTAPPALTGAPQIRALRPRAQIRAARPWARLLAARRAAGGGPPPGTAGAGWVRAWGLGFLGLLLTLHLAYGDGLGAPIRRLGFDALAASHPRERTTTPAMVVAIDEASVAAYGQWPWPRNDVARLIEAIRAAGARAIGIDILFVEPDRLSPRALAPWLGRLDPALGPAVLALGDTDAVLAATLARGGVVLAVAGAPAPVPPAALPAPAPTPGGDAATPAPSTTTPSTPPRAAPAAAAPRAPAVVWSGAAPRLPGYDGVVQSLAPLSAAAEGLGAITFDGAPDGVVRRVWAVQRLAGADRLILGAETLRAASGAFFATGTAGPGRLDIDLGDRRLTAEPDGTLWLHWGRADPDRYLPARAVLEGRGQALAGRVVLLAVTALGAIDSQRTPLGEEVYGIEAHLQLIEQIDQGRFLRRPPWAFWAETLALVLGGLLLVRLVPVAGAVRAVATVVALAAGLALTAHLGFRAGFLLDAAAPGLGLTLVGALLLSLTLVHRDRDRLRALIAFERVRADRERLQGGIDAAARIQLSLLPARRLTRPGLDLACHIAPARDIGGDFFDHFPLADGRLFFSVGDVSGKGIEASLFMALSKSLWKAAALRPDADLAAIQSDANRAIERDNAGAMFVTGLAAILDPGTGRLWYSSAGHDQPFRFGLTPPAQLPEFGGPVAGLDGDADFAVGEATLAPGEALCLFTDGVSEAMDAAGTAYGLDRLAARLASLAPGGDAAAALDWVLADVAAFVGGAAPSDDLTLMVLRRPA